MKSFNILHVYFFVAGGASTLPISESSQDIRPSGSGQVDGINEVKEQIISAINAVNLRDIAPETVFAREVEIAHIVSSGIPKIARLAEDESSLVSAQSAIDTLHEQTMEKLNEMNKLLPAGTDSNTLAEEYLETVGREAKRKLDSILEQMKTAQVDVQIMNLAEELLALTAISSFLARPWYRFPRDIQDFYISFDKVLSRNIPQARDIKSIVSRFGIVADFVEKIDKYSSLSTSSKKSLIFSCASVVKKNSAEIAKSGSVGDMAVRYFTMGYIDRLSEALNELNDDERSNFYGDGAKREKEIKWVSAILEKFIDSFADGHVDTFLTLSEVVKRARNEFAAGSLEENKEHDEILRQLITYIGKLLSKLDEVEKESKNEEEDEDDEDDS